VIDRNATAFEVGASLAADLVLKFATRDMSPEDRDELVKYSADIANRLISQIAGRRAPDDTAQEPVTP
jgi:adenylate kinase